VAYYVDTSAYMKLVVAENDSAALRGWIEQTDADLVSSDLLRTEALRAARRHSHAALAQTRVLLEGLTLVAVSTDICERAAELDPSILRSLDAVHLATALVLGDQLQCVVTYDDRLASACAAHGVAVIAPR